MSGGCAIKIVFQAEISRHAENILLQSTDAKGRRLKVTRVPVPPPQFITLAEEAGTEVAVSQLSYICQEAVYLLDHFRPSTIC